MIKDALVLEILFPDLVVTPDFAKKFEASSSRIFPFVYFSKAKRTILDFFSTTIVFGEIASLTKFLFIAIFLKTVFRYFSKNSLFP